MDVVLAAGCLVGGLLAIMMGFYLTLCFICWIGEVVEDKRYKYWFKNK